VAVLTVAAAEAVLRIGAVQELLPPPEPYYHTLVDRKERLLERTLRDAGGIDVLFVGTSAVIADFDPTTFDAERGKTGTAPPSFNGGLPGMAPGLARLYLERFYLPRNRPAALFHGVRAQELVMAPEPRDIPILGRIERGWLSDAPWRDRAGLLLTRTSALVYYAGLPSLVVRRRRTSDLDPALLGWLPYPGEMSADPTMGLPSWMADPVWDMRPGRQALRRSAGLAREAGIPFALVVLPEHPSLWATDRTRAGYAAFLAELDALARDEGVYLLDVTEGDLGYYGQNHLFFDRSHLSPRGARRFSAELARLWERVRLEERGGGLP
jgi:hypothetical protein